MKELTEIFRLLAKAIEQNTVNTYQEQGSAAADVVFRTLEDAEKRIDSLTSDMVQVVRCKDCIHRDPEDKKCDCSFQAKGGIFPMDDDDFCSYGERRKGDG